MKHTLITTIMISLGFMLCFVLLLPQYRYIRADQTFLAQRQIIAQKAADAQIVLEDVSIKAAGEYKPILDRLSAAVPAERDLDYLISAMTTIVRDSGLTMKDIKFTGISAGNSGPGVPAAGGVNATLTGSTTISLSLTGSYGDFIHFLNNIENSTRLFDVMSISFSSGDQGQLTYTVNVQTYNLNAKPLSVPSETPSPAPPPGSGPASVPSGGPISSPQSTPNANPK